MDRIDYLHIWIPLQLTCLAVIAIGVHFRAKAIGFRDGHHRGWIDGHASACRKMSINLNDPNPDKESKPIRLPRPNFCVLCFKPVDGDPVTARTKSLCQHCQGVPAMSRMF